MNTDFIEAQLTVWPEANDRYRDLAKCERRQFRVGDMQGYIQFNPARKVSTGAATDARSIAARPCFLCDSNRPAVQQAIPLDGNWQLLLNPFPIFPVHFTISSRTHIPQERPPLEMVSFAERMPDLCIFFNGARAGASAPDHAHMQGVLAAELPLLRLVEKAHPHGGSPYLYSDDCGLDLPFSWHSAIITPDNDGMKLMALMLQGGERLGIDYADSNVYAWNHDGLIRLLIVPRDAHRPECYPDIMVSPGAVDMAGIIITPRREDFERLDDTLIGKIYRECGH